MDEYTADALVNRDEPIPVISVSLDNVPTKENGTPSSDPEHQRRRDRFKRNLSVSNLKDKIHDVATGGKSESGASLQDRLFAKLLQQVIPPEDAHAILDSQDERATKNITRPGFSLPLMTSNFRRFNARIGVVFVFQNRLLRLLTWRTTSHTLSLLAVHTLICFNPYLLAVLPIAVILLFIMVPAFLVRHPPAPPTPLYTSSVGSGPPLAPPRTIRPATEMSKDFFRNMRDLQNCMDDFSTGHDLVVSYVAPQVNFSNEPFSSILFLFLFMAGCLLFLVSHLLPWRFICLVVGWTTIALGHPKVQEAAFRGHQEHIKPHEKTLQAWIDSWIDGDIVLDAPPEIREVEIFELQRRRGGSSDEWESWMFSPSPYDPLSPARIAGEKPNGTRFFEDVMPPKGWQWQGKKWVLDFQAQEWVEERMVQGVEVDLEGERWVSDLQEATDPAEADDGQPSKTKGKVRVKDWEEGHGVGKTGEWRRRRWVRMVQRRSINRCT
ncbi:MAG: hypothetical protein FRX48_07785 [Lasallia pustulata]|uniref:TECPR1-like DysF domain-containing protein n=1 Tax=Lasallia pustulata TaxID=136370 RepID=A0A5M8PI27_9LECA|nr:MAG: hypothetical protein FRX48_07785 [Lasallia pustulata]